MAQCQPEALQALAQRQTHYLQLSSQFLCILKDQAVFLMFHKLT